MDTLFLSRLQFAVTCMFHFIFVPLTLGLSVLTAYMETRYVRTGDATYLRMARFWGKLFLINFALGIVTGITMEFQFGMNWAEYSKYVGDIFGAPLAIEATTSFFLESVFIGLWVFGWNKVSKRVHALSIWLVAIASNLSALWILLANGWMQHPVGYVLRNGRAEMVDFGALVLNKYGWLEFVHTVVAGYVLAAFFVMGVSAYHILRKHQEEVFLRSFRIASVFGLASILFVVSSGDRQAVELASTQPSKFAAMESVWETQGNAPLVLFTIPDAANERNRVEILRVPGMLSLMAFHDQAGTVKGMKDFPETERPPVLPTFLSFRMMCGLGAFMLLTTLLAVFHSMRGELAKHPVFLKLMLLSIPVPYLAIQLGWVVTEVGRQPWIVYGVLKTADGVSDAITVGQVVASLVGFTVLYGGLAVLDVWLLVRFAKKGAEDVLPVFSKAR